MIELDCEGSEAEEHYFAADNYAAEAMAADMDPWIVFDARKTPKAEFDDWLETNRPSRVCRFGDPERNLGNVGWIAVYGPNYCPYQGHLDGLHDDWERLQESGRPVKFETIRELALNHDVLTAKKQIIVENLMNTRLLEEGLSQALLLSEILNWIC
ncbi:UPF0696 protein C11orf68 homolog isoform X2 [Polypterus senegalus]|uniref:UPF0696 protein C11orf68 homolog isoform X2 n=1 Tax=Polypterus senegalus TaxID=55291 RepID=UPI001962E8A0|nr:UPF0696 protein C11orf68 homolog isoform X2 [Polypterus senegalus]